MSVTRQVSGWGVGVGVGCVAREHEARAGAGPVAGRVVRCYVSLTADVRSNRRPEPRADAPGRVSALARPSPPFRFRHLLVRRALVRGIVSDVASGAHLALERSPGSSGHARADDVSRSGAIHARTSALLRVICPDPCLAEPGGAGDAPSREGPGRLRHDTAPRGAPPSRLVATSRSSRRRPRSRSPSRTRTHRRRGRARRSRSRAVRRAGRSAGTNRWSRRPPGGRRASRRGRS